MEYVDVDEVLNQYRLANDWGHSAEIAELVQTFPDLKLARDHWGQIKFCSSEANPEVDTLEIESCHSCDGKPLKVWAFMTIDQRGTRLYSDPPCFIVADQNVKGFGEIARSGWREMLEEHNLCSSVVAKVKNHLERHPPISYFED